MSDESTDWKETAAILDDQELMTSIRSSVDDIKAGRVHDHADVCAELNAEFRNEDEPDDE